MTVSILTGDALAVLRGLPGESVQCCVTSPPYYGLRDYGTAEWHAGDPGCDHRIGGQVQDNKAKGAITSGVRPGVDASKCLDCGARREDAGIGLEATPEAHIARLVEVFAEVRRVLRRDGTLWLNYGDAYASTVNGRSAADTKAAGADDRTFRDKPVSTVGHGAKPKDLLMLPSRVALALQADGWWLRSMLPWVKRSAMPESATDRPATAVEYVFLLTKSARYYYDAEAVRQTYQPDSVARVARGRSDQHKWADGGPGDQTLARDISKACTSPNGRNFRNSDLFFASLEPPFGLISGEDGPALRSLGEGGRPLALDVNPAGFAEAHFATFPPRLIEPLIKAGSSEKGRCPACAAPWLRELEKATGGLTDWQSGGIAAGKSDQVKIGQQAWDTYQSGKTLGWLPSCDCKAFQGYPHYDDDTPKPVPCTVLDPFGGAGTTGLVADRLGRDAILIELNPEYAEMARKRIQGDAPLLTEVRA